MIYRFIPYKVDSIRFPTAQAKITESTRNPSPKQGDANNQGWVCLPDQKGRKKKKKEEFCVQGPIEDSLYPAQLSHEGLVHRTGKSQGLRRKIENPIILSPKPTQLSCAAASIFLLPARSSLTVPPNPSPAAPHSIKVSLPPLLHARSLHPTNKLSLYVSI